MTIEYKDSKRIVALSTDYVPDISDVSDSNWTVTGLNYAINSGVIDWDGVRDSSVDGIHIDLGAGNISDTQWVLRFKMVTDAVSSPSSGSNIIFIAVSDAGVQPQSTGSEDSLGYYERRHNSTAHKQTVGYGDEASLLQNIDDFNITAPTTETKYIEMKRTSATSFTVTRYSDEFVTVKETAKTVTIPSTIQSLRYIKIQNKQEAASGGTFNGTISDIKFWNDTTTAGVTAKNHLTNVQDNSLLVEKDTARRYWFDAQTGTTPTYNDNFSTYADQAAADAAWVSNDTADFRVNITNDNFAFDSKVTSTTNTGAYYDLGSALSDTAWVVDFKLVITTNTLYSSGAVNAATYITMNDATNGGAIGGTVDAMGFYISGASSGSKFNVTWAKNSYLNRGGGTFTGTITTGTFYMRLKRTGATSVKLEVYSDATRTSSSLIEEKEVTGTDSGITGLRYLRIQDNQSSAGTGTGQQIGTIDDVSIYDGVTTATAPYSPATWNEDMTGVTGALTVDNFTVGTSTQASSTGTESHTISASSKEKKILLVTVRTAGVDSTISSCTYAGVAMTNLGTDTTGAGNYTRQTCFYLLDPPTGTADIVATKSNSSAHCKIIALSLYGAKQSAPTFAINAGSFSPTSGITTNITPPANSWVYSSLSGSTPTNSTNDPPSTYYTNAELTVLNSNTSVTGKKYGLKKDPTTGSPNAVQMYFKHPSNSNNQPVVLSVFAVEPLE